MFYKKVNKKIEKLNENLENSKIVELSYILGNKKEIAKRNLLAGLFKGIGIGIGVTLITALIIFMLKEIVKLNIPVIGEYISDIVDIVQNQNNQQY